MKKFIPVACVILIALLFSGCTSDYNNDEDAATIAQIQGKWKLTLSYSGAVNTTIVNGYEIEFKADKTFISNEENGYNSGTYSVLESIPNNLRLIFQKSWEAKQVYKYITAVDDQHIYIQASTPEPTPDSPSFSAGYVLTRVP